MSTQKPGTTLTITDKDLSAIAERIAGDPRCKISKQGILNMMAAGLFGPKTDWGRIRNAQSELMSQRAEAKAPSPTKEIARRVELRNEEDGAVLPVVLGLRADGIHVTAKDGREVWVEHNDGCLKVHAYSDVSDGPVSVWSKPGHVIRALTGDHVSELHPGMEDAPLTETDSWMNVSASSDAGGADDPDP